MMCHPHAHIAFRIDHFVSANFAEHLAMQLAFGLDQNHRYAKILQNQCRQDAGLNIFPNRHYNHIEVANAQCP
ncbi:hypothetical protein D3C75_730870 [compost metagenome]